MLEILLIQIQNIKLAIPPSHEDEQLSHYVVEGDGFFRLERDGEIVYAKEFSPRVKGGKLVNETGLPLSPPVHVPPRAQEIQISEYGYVYANINGNPKTLSQLVLAKFPENTPFLQEGTLIKIKAKPTLGHPKADGFGAVIKKGKPTPYITPPLQTDIDTATVKTNTKHSAIQTSPPSLNPSLPYTYIKVKPFSTVRGNEIRLGAVAEIQGPLSEKLQEISLGPTPAIGTSRLITEVTLQSALRSAKLSDLPISWEVPPKASVRRATRTLAGKEIEEFARKWLQENSYEPSEWRLSSPITDRVIPDEEFTVSVERKQETETSLILTLQFKNSEEVFLTKQVALLKSSPRAPSLKIGDRVRVLVQSGLVTVETHGTVKFVGKNGEVTVEIDETKAIFSGKLQPNGTVEVKL